jgi:phosphatidylglycerol:prolipoprotein diacylglycerol transferase
MVNINVDPILLRFGPFALTWHGLCLAGGLLVLTLIFLQLGLRAGFSRQALSQLALWWVPGGIFGARLFHVLQNWGTYAREPTRILAIHEGGLAVNGLVLMALAIAVLFARRKKLDVRKLMDVMALASPVGGILIRVGCTINGDVWGVPTGGAWGLVYWHPDSSIPAALRGVPTVPIPTLYQLLNLGILLFLVALRRQHLRDGSLCATGLVLYALGCLVIGFWCPGEVLALGLTLPQWVATGMGLLGIGLMAWIQIPGVAAAGAWRAHGQ